MTAATADAGAAILGGAGGVMVSLNRIQPGPLLDEHLCWNGAGLAVDAGVDVLAERPGRFLQRGEGTVVLARVREGTRSRLAMRTVDSAPPLDCGSAGMQVRTVVP